MDFSPHMAVLRSLFSRMRISSAVCYFRAPSVTSLTSLQPAGASTAWLLLCETRSRRIGVRVCPPTPFDFSSTAFDPCKWTMVVFCKEDSGRQLRLSTRENGGGGETHHQDLVSLMILMFLLVLLTHLRRHQNLLDRQIRLDYHQDCPQLLHLLVGKEEQELKMYRVGDHDHDLNDWSLN